MSDDSGKLLKFLAKSIPTGTKYYIIDSKNNCRFGPVSLEIARDNKKSGELIVIWKDNNWVMIE